jgi:hypothetical protein
MRVDRAELKMCGSTAYIAAYEGAAGEFFLHRYLHEKD